MFFLIVEMADSVKSTVVIAAQQLFFGWKMAGVEWHGICKSYRRKTHYFR